MKSLNFLFATIKVLFVAAPLFILSSAFYFAQSKTGSSNQNRFEQKDYAKKRLHLKMQPSPTPQNQDIANAVFLIK